MSISATPGSATRTAGKAALLFVLYLLSMYATIALSRHIDSFAVVWPATAIAVAFLLLAPPREWPAYVLAAGIANVVAIMLAGRGLPAAAEFAACNLLEMLLAATALHRLRAPGGWLATVRSLVAFLSVAGAMVPAISAALVAAILHATFDAPYWAVFQNRWVADGVGMLIIAPLLLAWLRPETAPPEKRPGAVETMAVAAGLVAATALTFSRSSGSLAAHHTSLVLALPFQIWATLRFGARGATTANAFVVLVGIAGMMVAGGAPLNQEGAADALIALQAFLAATSLATLLLAAALTERRTAEIRLRDAVESIGAGFALFDADDRLVLSNSMHGRMYAKNAKMLVPGTRFEDILRGSVARGQHPDADGRSDDWVTERMRRHLNPGDPIEQHIGNGQWLLICERRTSDGGIVGTWTDISRQKAQEDALRENEAQLRLAEARARAAEARLRDAIDNMHEGLTLYDADGRLVLTNRRMQEIYPNLSDVLAPGTTYEEFLRQGVARGIFTTDGRSIDAWLPEFMRLPLDQRQDVETDLADGRWLLISRQRTADGGTVQVRTDITRLKQQENALRENEERLRLAEARLRDAVESIGEGISLFDAEDRLVLSNSAHRRWYGKGADLFVPGTRFEDIIRAGIALGHHPDAAGREEAWVAERLHRHRNPGEPFEQPIGEGRWERVSERRTSDGGTVGVWTDISGLKLQEETLRRNGEQLRAAEARARAAEQQLLDAIEQLDEAFVLFDAEDRLILCNERFRELCNESAHPVVPGITFETIVRDCAEGGFIADAEGRVEEWIAERMQRHRKPGAPFELQQADGRWLLIADRRTADGGYVGIRTDISRLKNQGLELKNNEERLRGMLRELEESHAKLERQSFMLTKLADEAAARGAQAQSANLAKSQFLANVSHELRTPLNAILGFSEIMKDEILGPLGSAQYRGYAADIHDSGTLLLSVINDLLDLSKIEAGKYELHEEDCTPAAILRDAIRLVAERADAAGVGIRQRVPAGLPGLRADGRLVKQILLNLLTNAIKFTPAGGTITLGAEVAAEGGLSLTVTDTGIGIPLDQMERVLQPFIQVESIMTRSHTGTGLGLPLCKALAELHGARLLLASEIGHGTTATIAFPAERTIRLPGRDSAAASAA